MFLTILVISVVIVALSIVGLGVSIFFKKNGKFPETGVGHNPEMKNLGLSCARSDEIKKHNLQQDINSAKGTQPDFAEAVAGCSGCSCSDAPTH